MIAIGQVRNQRVLGTAATYRIVELLDAGLVRVEVLSAPGLLPGATLRLVRSAVEAMEVVDAVGDVDADLRGALERWAA